jgi:hypothetical protein
MAVEKLYDTSTVKRQMVFFFPKLITALLSHCTPPSPQTLDEREMIELYREFTFSQRC